MILGVLLVASAYIVGSIPTALLLTKLFSKKDLRTFGTGAVTTSNASHAVGAWIAPIIGILDILKGAALIWVAQAIGPEHGLGLAQQMAIGIASVVGHNWSMFLGFKGGRGLSPTIGVILALARVELVLFIMTALLGILLSNNIPLFMGIAMVLLPVWSGTLEQPGAIITGNGILALLVFIKRFTDDGPPKQGGTMVYVYRLLFDRDTKSREAWVNRGELATAPAVAPIPVALEVVPPPPPTEPTP